MKVNYLISFLLEPLSFLISFIAIVFLLQIKDNKIEYKILVAYYLLGFAIHLCVVFVRPNTQLYSYLYLLSGVSISLYFFFLLKSTEKKWLILLPAFITILYYLFEQFFVRGIKLFPSMGYVVVSICLILLAFVYFYQLLTHVNEEPLVFNFDFWFVCSLLVYHLGAFGIFLTYNNLTKKILPSEHYSYENRVILTLLWEAHNVLLFITNLMIWIGVICIVRKMKTYK